MTRAMRLALSALGLMAVLVLTGEFRWGGGASELFAGVWVVHAASELMRARVADHG